MLQQTETCTQLELSVLSVPVKRGFFGKKSDCRSAYIVLQWSGFCLEASLTDP